MSDLTRAPTRNEWSDIADEAAARITELESSDNEAKKLVSSLEETISDLKGKFTALEQENAALMLQAKSWAMEAKAQRSTVHECLQAASGSTGEKADWNGSRPIKEKIEALEQENARLREALTTISNEKLDHEIPDDQRSYFNFDTSRDSMIKVARKLTWPRVAAALEQSK